MKETPQEKKIYQDFRPGKLTKEGFLGSDTRHVHEIIEEDKRTLSQLGIEPETIADRMQYFIEEGKKGLESNVDLGDFTVRVNWFRGMLPCPFGEPNLHHKITAVVRNKALNQEITFTQLGVHLIGSHCFFMGHGNRFRLEPDDLVKFLKIN
ncbi:MAG: hypothetical protein V2J62_01120 [candidate division KSB1 bacterium]|jgi:hypothetical protein|nr:hypothetical protein [candidate division KSB1 bacterium]